MHIRSRIEPHDASDAEIRALTVVPDGCTVLKLTAISENRPAYTDSSIPWDHVHYERFQAKAASAADAAEAVFDLQWLPYILDCSVLCDCPFLMDAYESGFLVCWL